MSRVLIIDLDGVVRSWDGSIVGNRRAFQAVLAELGREPKDCLFVDDHPENVTTAVELGLYGHLFRSPAGLAHFLASSRLPHLSEKGTRT